jgi:hypothetical protein
LHGYFTERGDQRKASRDAQKDDTKKEEDKGNEESESEEEKIATTTEEQGEDELTMMTSTTVSIEQQSEFSGSTLSSTRNQKHVFLQIVPMILYGEEGTTLSTYGLLDNCSMSTFIREDVASKLKLRGNDKKVNIGTINKTDPLVVPEVSLQVSPKDGSRMFEIKSAYVRPASQFNMPARPSFTDCIDAYKRLDGIEFDAVNPSEISILIGANVPEAVLMKGFRFGSKNQPLAVDTPFGWTLFGPSLARKVPSPVMSESINLALNSLWEKEVREPTEYVNLLTSDDNQTLNISVERFGNKARNDTGRSQEGRENLHWCNTNLDQQNDRAEAIKRFS